MKTAEVFWQLSLLLKLNQTVKMILKVQTIHINSTKLLKQYKVQGKVKLKLYTLAPLDVYVLTKTWLFSEIFVLALQITFPNHIFVVLSSVSAFKILNVSMEAFSMLF